MIVLRRLVADRRRGFVWWALGTAFGVASTVALWPTVRDSADIEQVMKDLPTAVRALIGSQEGIPLISAAGYLQVRLISTVLPVLLLVYAIGLGSRAIGGAEEDGTLQLVATAPISRRHLAVARLAASVLLLVGLAVVALAVAAGIGAAEGMFEEISLPRLVLATAAVVVFALLHLALAFAVGAATGRRSPAVAVASAVAVAGYLLHGLAASASAVEWLRLISPWWWLLDRNLFVQDPTFLAFGLPVVLALVFSVLGVVAFARRDLRFP